MSRKKEPSPFRFKKFSVCHHRSSMKVGVDGVLIGCWADCPASGRILDVGCGCGLISLITAQRFSDSSVTGIDVDTDSVAEASFNAAVSPWPNRIAILDQDFNSLAKESIRPEYDLIISNPPYFDSGVTDITTRREQARHQGELSPSVILRGGLSLLKRNGLLAMIVPTDISCALEDEATLLGFFLERRCIVRGHNAAPFKRTMLQWRKSDNDDNFPAPELTELTLEVSPGIPTEDYRRLCRDFYLKF